jgi:hypothetical protein
VGKSDLTRRRGPNKAPPWVRTEADGLSIIRLALDTSDPVQLRLVESMFQASFSLRQALQRDGRSRLDAFWAASHERARDGRGPVLERLGLSKKALEYTAYEHLDRAPHLRRFVTKALAMHMADSVWAPIERHLFPDANGDRFGKPGVGSWYEFTRIPGRARSHTREGKWETFRLHGSLGGHRLAYTGGDGRFYQPDRMRPVSPDESWWKYSGPLAVVFTGIPGGTLVLPVRLPASPSNQAILDHHLPDPSRWHKIDLVRSRDPRASGGWRYEAHLTVLKDLYASPATKKRRQTAAVDTAGRRVGVDVNVSNVSIASVSAANDDLRISRVERDAGAPAVVKERAAKKSRRERALDRSRRAGNPDQYELSEKQLARADDRAAVGRPPVQVIPKGPRKAHAGGRPKQGYRKDQLSNRYRRIRSELAAQEASAAQARRDQARLVAGAEVLRNGFRLTVEDCSLRSWAKLWGRSLHAFAPGLLLSALHREAEAVAEVASTVGGVVRASTRTTALSQHCLCGHRAKKALATRTHDCPQCGLVGDRDAVSATLAALVTFTDRVTPASALVDFVAGRTLLEKESTRAVLRDSLRLSLPGRQEARFESTSPATAEGSAFVEPGRTPPKPVVARTNVGMALRPTPDEPGATHRTTSDRTQTRTDGSRTCDKMLSQLRDTS